MGKECATACPAAWLLVAAACLSLFAASALAANSGKAAPQRAREYGFVEEALLEQSHLERTPEAAAVIAAIERSEAALLEGVVAEYEVTWKDPPQFFGGGTWARKGYKGLLDAMLSVKFADGRRITNYRRATAFDGSATYFFEVYPKVGGTGIVQYDEGHVGGVISSQAWDIDSYPSPARLLGQALKREGRCTLSELLQEAREVALRPSRETIDGHECLVLDFDRMGATLDGLGRQSPLPGWISIWVDPERGHRPLRIETYIDNSGHKQLTTVIDHIELDEVDGLWLPVKGLRSTFHLQSVLDEGYTEQRLRMMDPEEARKHVRLELVPTLPPKTITVKSWKLGADDSLFTIDFPKGAEVYNEFRRRRYVVGEPDESEPTPLGELQLNRDPEPVPERLRVYLDGRKQTTAHVYLFSQLVEPQMKIVSAKSDLAGIAAKIEKPDEGSIRHPVTLTVAAIGRSGRRYGKLILKVEPSDLGDVEIPVMIAERTVLAR